MGTAIEVAQQEVRVTRSGNTRALPIPAGLARDIGLEPGDRYELRIVGDTLIYSPAGQSGTVANQGTGADRIFVAVRDRVTFVDSTQGSVTLLNDWDF
jgi:antitoxin component of MazEF toxin-antitoxin module